ncbi:hypothetical protein PVIIG_06060 [Plasmodium vivax India VII]|uniref:Uncharacterized protein n=1 Tax=Plasmodium vivax India VII TaxID=1077284 RepID=A0A0J9S374_PLAVI|nr:hypothetical protein PVIIG_06060 [Plasmodium vivax India VII]
MSDPDIDYYQEGVDKTQIINLLKEQKLYNLYNQFNNELKPIADSVNCDAKCNEKLPKKEGEELELCDLCKNMCNLLLNFSNIEGFCKDSSCRTQFTFMNLWLYEKIKKISSSNSLISNFYDALKTIKKTKRSMMDDCPIVNFNEYDINNFKPIKYVYEFLHIFSDIIGEISGNHELKEKLYCKHIQQFFKYYNNIIGKCNNESKPLYCTQVNHLPTKINSVMINTILSKCDYVKTTCENGSPEIAGIPCLKEEEDKPVLPKTDGVPPELVRTLSTSIISLIPIVTTISIFYKVSMFFIIMRNLGYIIYIIITV